MTRYRASAEVYDRAEGTFKLTDSMSIRRIFHTATTLADGTVLIAGGISIQCSVCNGTIVASVERYDPGRKKFFPTANMLAPRARHSATLVDDGRVLITGGHDLNSYLSSAELYDPVSGTFSAAGPMVSARAFAHTATRLQDGRVLIVGDNVPAEIYDPTNDSFSPTGGLHHPRRGGHTATALFDGRVLVAGGLGNVGGSLSEISQAELYDPLSGTFSPVGDLIVPRSNHGAALLATGAVLLVGGGKGSDILTSLEVYDPASALFSPAGALNEARANHVQLHLSSGEVLVVGGVDASHTVTSTAELIRP